MKYSILLNLVLSVVVVILFFKSCDKTPIVPTNVGDATGTIVPVINMSLDKLRQKDSIIGILEDRLRKQNKKINQLVSLTRTQVETSGSISMPLVPLTNDTTTIAATHTNGITDTNSIINAALGSLSKEYGFTHEGKNLTLNGVSNILTGTVTVNYSYRMGLTHILSENKKLFKTTYDLEVIPDDPQANLTGQHIHITPPLGIDVSLQLGMGVNSDKKVLPYLGVGLSKTIWRINLQKRKNK